MAMFGQPYKQIGTAADGTPIWELSNFFDSQYDSLPTTGWRYIPAQPGSDNASPEAWQNLSTGAMANVNPSSVTNPFYSVGSISGQGEGDVTRDAYVGNDPYESYRSLLAQVFTGDARGMGQIQGDPNFNWSQYFDPLAAGTRIDQALPHANAGIQKLIAARPDLTIRAGPWGSGFVPWESMDDYSRRNDYFNPGEGFFEGMFDYAGEVAGDLWNTPLPAMAAMAAGVGMAGGAAGASGSAAAGGSAAGGGNAFLMSLGEPVTAAQLAELGFSPELLSAAAGYGGAAASGLPSVGPTAATVPSTPMPSPSAFAGTAPGIAGGGGAAASTGLSSLLSSPTALGMGAGALLGGLGGSQQAGTVTTEEGLPDWLMPYAKPALDKYAADLQNYQIDPYGVMPSAMKEFQNTISGMYLDPSTNKYLEDYFKLGAERIKGSLSPSFGHMQAFGAHSGYNEALSRGLGDFSTGLYGGAYEKERDRQSQMTAAAPSFLGQSSTAQFAPYQQYLGTLGSLGKKKDQPFFENPFGNILGGAMVGGSFGNIWK